MILEEPMTTAAYDNQTGASSDPDSDSIHWDIIYIGIGCLGVLDNTLVVVVIFSYTSMRKKVANMFITNQSAVDLAVGFLVATNYIATLVTSFDHLHGTWGDVVCKLWLSSCLIWAACTTSTFNLVALTLERYCMVCHPLTYKRSFSKRKARVTIALVWVFGFTYNILYIVPTSHVVDGKCLSVAKWPNEITQHAVGVLNIVLLFFIPLAILCFSYCRMIAILRQKVRPADISEPTTSQADDQPRSENRKSRAGAKMARASRNIIKTLAIVTISFVLCWSWNQFFFLVYNLGANLSFSSGFYQFSIGAVFLNCCINPFIYIFKYEEFQLGLKKLFCRKKSDETSGVSSIQEAASRTH